MGKCLMYIAQCARRGYVLGQVAYVSGLNIELRWVSSQLMYMYMCFSLP